MTVSQEKKKGQSLHLESLTWGDLTWVNIEQPTERETGYLAQNYPFHPLDLDDCLSLRQRPKLDVYKDYLFFIFPFSVWDKMTRVSRHDQVSVFVGEKYLITVHSGQLRTLVALFHQCQIDEEVRQQNFGSGSGYLLYRILDRTVDSYFPILNSILAWIEEVEDRVFDENVEAVKEVAVLRRDIVTQRRILHSLRVVTAELESKSKRFCKIDISVQFGDLMDHLNKICDSLDEAREVVEIFKDTDYILSTDRLNRIIRVLTIFGSILLPFLMVSSIYGMNIPLPGGLEKGSLLGFLILVTIMLLTSGSMLYFFRRRHWT
ncbi:MAG: magnesium transporter CorA family protein [Chloroflexi bacterium]|nr:magnesium transporter CorA family protein [Chloroflexota bacterium]